MRRGMNGNKNGPASTVKQNSGGTGTTGGRRAVSTDENNVKPDVKNVMDGGGDEGVKMAGPVTARLKMMEKKCSQIFDIQMKFKLLDKWITQQFGIKLFPTEVVNMEKIANGSPEDAENPFYSVYLVCQRLKFLEEKVKKLEARPYEDMGELKPTSNYSSSHAFRNYKAQGKSSGGVKRTYGNSSPSTPKKPKLIPRPVAPSSNYPFKPSVKILPKDPNVVTPLKKDPDELADVTKAPTMPKKLVLVDEKEKEADAKLDSSEGKEQVEHEKSSSSTESKAKESGDDSTPEKPAESQIENKESTSESMDIDKAAVDDKEDKGSNEQQETKGEPVEEVSEDALVPELPVVKVEDLSADEVVGEDSITTGEKSAAASEKESLSEDALLFDDAAAPVADDMMEFESGQEESEMEVEHKPAIPLDDDVGGDISGSEASVSSFASSSSKPRLSTRRKKAVLAAAATASSSGKNSEEEKPVMYTARGRRHTVPRRYAEFTGHDNVVSILKSQQRAEKSAAAGSSKAGKRQSTTPTKAQDTPPRIRKMVKNPKTPSPKKSAMTDSEGDGDGKEGKKKAGGSSSSGLALPQDRPPCVDVLVDKVMGREVDSDGMVVLSESYENIFVNQQQLVGIIVKSNGKSTRLTRKMTTLVFEDSVLASASPFGTKYYKDRLPPEPLEAMVDFIAESGFEPHYSKKKIYMIVGQVCNEARAGRVSRKFMQPMEPGTSGGQLECLSEASSPASQSTPP